MHIKSFGLLGMRRLNFNKLMTGTSLNPRNVEQHQASSINIFAGPNGGGKSTVLDMVRALTDFDALKTIARENMNTSTASASIIHFDSGVWVGAVFNKQDIDAFGLYLCVTTPPTDTIFSGVLHKNSSKPPKELKKVLDTICAKISWRTSHDERGVSEQEFSKALNRDASHLVGLAPYPVREGQICYSTPPSFSVSSHDLSNPIEVLKRGQLSVSLNDDRLQRNHVPMKMLPSGWRAYGGLIAWLNTRSDGEICVIEEPETHMHPTLQRLLMGRISQIIKDKCLQLFISTHSSVLIDVACWPGQHPKLFEADGITLSELTSPAVALAGLGIRPSDVFQANGIVWVEGASDRIYLMHWLSLWCYENKKELPIENLNFSFAFYGGAMLSHFSTEADDNLIDIFSINRNSIVVMDRDLDFVSLPNGIEQCASESSVKYKVWNGFRNTIKPHSYCWVTEGYTIESYLPSNFADKYYAHMNGRLRAVSSHSKVVIAKKFRDSHESFSASYSDNSDLPAHIEKLYNMIQLWNS